MHGHGRSLRLVGCAALALLLAATTLPNPIEATTSTWKVRADTTLTADFVGSIEIVRDGVTLDCSGHKITGDDHGRGIVIDNRIGVTVKDCEVEHFSAGIWVAGTTDSTFIGNNVHHSVRGAEEGWVQGEGFWIQSSSGNEFRDNRSTDNSSDGLGMRNAHDNLIAGFTISDNGGAGLWVEKSDGNRFIRNEVAGCRAAAVLNLGSSHNTYESNSASACAWGGFWIEAWYPDNARKPSNANRLIGNAATGNGGVGFLVTEDAADNTLTGNTAVGNGAGFGLARSATRNILTDNISQDNSQYGFGIGPGATGNMLDGNAALDNTAFGFQLGGNDNTLTDNVATDNGAGFWIGDGATGNILEDNTASGSGYGGFVIVEASDNTLVENTAQDNADRGFIVDAASGNHLDENTATGNGQGGFLVNNQATGNTLTGNWAYDNADGGFVIAAGSHDNTLSRNHGTTNVYGFLAVGGATANTFQENDAHGNTALDAAQDGTSAGNFWIDNCFGTIFGIPDQTSCS